MPYSIKSLTINDVNLFHQLLNCFEEVFDEPHNYGRNRPDDEYIKSLLSDDTFIALVALDDDKVIGGLAAYELRKFEQPRSEIYIYDLAVYEEYRRQGVATALIKHLKPIARERGAWVIIVQADQNDDPPINLYTKLGKREDIHHFDIPVTDD